MGELIRLSAELETFQEEDKPIRFQGTAYSGGLIPDRGAVIDLDTLQNDGATVPALDSHWTDLDSVVGFSRIDRKKSALVVQGEVIEFTESGRLVANLLRKNMPLQLSVGITAESELHTPPAKLKINGKTVTVGQVFRNPLVREISFVAVGADPSTTVAAFQQEKKMSDDQVSKLTAELETLKAELTQERLAREQAQHQLDQFRQEVRLGAVKAFFNDVGIEYSEEKAKPYLSMADETFQAVVEQMQAINPKAESPPEWLFNDLATEGRAEKKSLLIEQAKGYGIRSVK